MHAVYKQMTIRRGFNKNPQDLSSRRGVLHESQRQQCNDLATRNGATAAATVDRTKDSEGFDRLFRTGPKILWNCWPVKVAVKFHHRGPGALGLPRFVFVEETQVVQVQVRSRGWLSGNDEE